MKSVGMLVFGLVVLLISYPSAADEFETVKFGNAEVIFNYQPPKQGVATLTVTALVSETNDSLRGVKNSDQRRLSKLGQLIYQCKLLLYKTNKSESANAKDPILVSKNYSLFTGIDLALSKREGVGIQVQSLQVVDDASVFTATLGARDNVREVQDYLGEGDTINLKQLNLDVLNDTDLLRTSETLDIDLRFPVFQLQQPVQQWHYSFDVKDFKQAVLYTNQYCTADKFIDLMNQER